jgi:hypothetical protein
MTAAHVLVSSRRLSMLMRIPHQHRDQGHGDPEGGGGLFVVGGHARIVGGGGRADPLLAHRRRGANGNCRRASNFRAGNAGHSPGDPLRSVVVLNWPGATRSDLISQLAQPSDDRGFLFSSRIRNSGRRPEITNHRE